MCWLVRGDGGFDMPCVTAHGPVCGSVVMPTAIAARDCHLISTWQHSFSFLLYTRAFKLSWCRMTNLKANNAGNIKSATFCHYFSHWARIEAEKLSVFVSTSDRHDRSVAYEYEHRMCIKVQHCGLAWQAGGPEGSLPRIWSLGLNSETLSVVHNHILGHLSVFYRLCLR